MITLNEIKEIIKNDKEEKKDKYWARKYYNRNPNKEFPSMEMSYEKDIVDKNGKIKTITKDKKTFMYTNYAKLLINQKIDYCLAKEPTLSNVFAYYENVEIADMLEDLTLEASLNITAWLFLYVDESVLKWILIPDWQIKPIFDKYNKKIEKIIRYYETKENKEDNQKIMNVEIWDITGVRTIKYKEKSGLDVIMSDEKESHYKDSIYYNGELENEESKNLPFVPFIPLYNNKNMENDLNMIKDQLDFYNIIKSGFVDNIFKFQDALMKLRGFAGDDNFLETTRKQMQKYKMISLSDPESDADYLKIDIPVEAREVILNSLKEDIFKNGQGLDPDKIGDGNITNIVIKNRYQALNMKSEKCIKQIKLFYGKFIDCLNKFYGTDYNKDIEFNKSVNFNETEIIDNCVKSMDIIPMDLILENHPWVKDVKEAKKLKEEEDNANIDKFNQSLINQNNDNNL
jgi:SPP1 family phage portal protein